MPRLKGEYVIEVKITQSDDFQRGFRLHHYDVFYKGGPTLSIYELHNGQEMGVIVDENGKVRNLLLENINGTVYIKESNRVIDRYQYLETN